MYIHAYTCTYMYIHVYTCLYMYIHEHTCICMYTHVYSCICMYIHIYACTSMYIHVSFGIILGSIWDQFGIILGSIWDQFGINLGSIGDNVGITEWPLGDQSVSWQPFGDNWGINWLPLGDHLDGNRMVTTLGSVWDPLVTTLWLFCEIQTLIKPKKHIVQAIMIISRQFYNVQRNELSLSPQPDWLIDDTSFSIWFGMRDMPKKLRGVDGRGLGRP